MFDENKIDKKIDEDKIKAGVKLILEGIGEDLDREGIKDTPDRVARMYAEIFAGMHEDAKVHLTRTFKADTSDMVIEKDISFYSTCEHHLMPFFGKVHIAYIPDDKVVGISKLARTVEVYARRPQLQEQLTSQIADAIEKNLNPLGIMVVIEAEHTCMTMRGVKKPGTKTVTMVAKGAFLEDKTLQDRFFQLLHC